MQRRRLRMLSIANRGPRRRLLILLEKEAYSSRSQATAELLWGQRFFDCDLVALLDVNHAVQTAVPGHGDIDHVRSRIQIKVVRRGFVERAVVHQDLRALGLRLHAHDSHAGRGTAVEDFFELPTCAADLFSFTQALEGDARVRRLPRLNVYCARLLQIAGALHRYGVCTGPVEGK